MLQQKKFFPPFKHFQTKATALRLFALDYKSPEVLHLSPPDGVGRTFHRKRATAASG